MQVWARGNALLNTPTNAWPTAARLRADLSGITFSALHDRRTTENPIAGGSYRTSDNRWLLLALVEGDKHWPSFTKAIGRDDLTLDSRFVNAKGRAADAEALVAELGRTFGGQPLLYWKMVLDGARLPYGIVQVTDEKSERVLSASATRHLSCCQRRHASPHREQSASSS